MTNLPTMKWHCKHCKLKTSQADSQPLCCVHCGLRCLVPVCPLCSCLMLRTSERWFACGQGHGRLVAAPVVDHERAQREDAEYLRRFDEALKARGK